MTLGSAIHHLNRASIVVVDRGLLALTGYFKDYAGSLPWSGTASAGTSASPTITSVGSDPSAGTALNGHGVATFDGSKYGIFSGTLDTYYNASNGSGWCLTKIATAASDVVNAYQNPCFMGEYSSGNAAFSIAFSTAGLRAALLSSTYNEPSPAVTQATGAWFLVQWRWNGTTFEFRKNGGAWSTVASGAVSSGMTGACHFGINFTTSVALIGDIAEIATSDITFTNAQFDQVLASINASYGLSLS